MIYTFTLPIAVLKAAALFSSTDQTRYNLSGICLHTIAGRLHIVATDGRRMLIIERASEMPHNSQFILPLVDFARIEIKHNEDVQISIDDEQQTVTYCTTFVEIFSITAKLIDGKFPDYLQVIDFNPSSPIPGIHINGGFLDQFLTAAKLINSRNDGLKIRQSSPSAPYQVTTADHGFFGLLMPMREGQNPYQHSDFELPPFVRALGKRVAAVNPAEKEGA